MQTNYLQLKYNLNFKTMGKSHFQVEAEKSQQREKEKEELQKQMATQDFEEKKARREKEAREAIEQQKAQPAPRAEVVKWYPTIRMGSKVLMTGLGETNGLPIRYCIRNGEAPPLAFEIGADGPIAAFDKAFLTYKLLISKGL